MKILIVGSGGREHALAWKCAQSKRIKQVLVAPGNAGTANEGAVIKNIDIASDDINSLAVYAETNHIDLTIVGPEVPLASGIVDIFQQKNLRIFGPSQAAHQLESSKSFCKDFMHRHHIPTASYETFIDYQTALDYITTIDFPIVIKADGLAAGKGVIIAHTLDMAKDTLNKMLNHSQFGSAGEKVVIEDFLVGEEASFICLADGKNLLPLASSQDHKARNDGDTGPNTGGMGAYSPAPVISASVEKMIMQTIMQPVIDKMADEGNPFVGFLYAGLMIDLQGNPRVLEFNCRLGDPETQPLMMRLKSDLVELCWLASQNNLDQASIEWENKSALGVVLASDDYPDTYRKGITISGLNDVQHSKLFFAGAIQEGNQIKTNGGRVLMVTALADDIKEAHQKAYTDCERIHWEGMFYRKDIGWRALKQ